MFVRLKYTQATSELFRQWRDTIRTYEAELLAEIAAMSVPDPAKRQVLFDTDAGRAKLYGIVAAIERRAIPVSVEVHHGEPQATRFVPTGAVH